MLIDNKLLGNIIIKVSKELSIPKDVVETIYKLYWRFIKETIESIPISKIENEEQFNEYKTSFNIVYIGKLYTDWNKIVGQRKRFDHINELREKLNKEKDET